MLTIHHRSSSQNIARFYAVGLQADLLRLERRSGMGANRPTGEAQGQTHGALTPAPRRRRPAGSQEAEQGMLGDGDEVRLLNLRNLNFPLWITSDSRTRGTARIAQQRNSPIVWRVNSMA